MLALVCVLCVYVYMDLCVYESCVFVCACVFKCVCECVWDYVHV